MDTFSYRFTQFFIVFLVAAMCLSTRSNAQTTPNADSIQYELTHKHSPKMAAIMSTVVPGLGQIYNRKYWKVPIIYGGMGVFVYFFNENNTKYKKYKEAYANVTSPGPSNFYDDPRLRNYSVDQKKDIYLHNKDAFRRYRDLNVILFSLLYVLNIVDASVDATFLYYDVSRDLSLRWQPTLLPINSAYGSQRNIPGLKLSFSLH